MDLSIFSSIPFLSKTDTESSMYLKHHTKIEEPDLPLIEGAFFARNKVSTLFSCGHGREDIGGIPKSVLHADHFSRHDIQEKFLQEIENGVWFLIITGTSMHGRPFQPPLRWVPDPKNKDDEQWGYTHFLQTSYKFHLESALARIQHSKRRWRGPAQIPEDEITPITGNSTAGILKRYANAATGGAAFPEHLTAAEEKGIGSKIR